MNWQVKVLSKVEAVDGDEVTLGLPDECGQIVTLKGSAEGNLDALIPGALYTVAFIPFVRANDLDSIDAPDANDSDMVPTDHPTVICSYDAASATSPQPEEIEVDDPGVAFELQSEIPPVAEAATEAPADPVTSESPLD